MESIFLLKFQISQIFQYLYLRDLPMAFYVYQKIVLFIINVQIIEIKNQKKLLNGMIKI